MMHIFYYTEEANCQRQRAGWDGNKFKPIGSEIFCGKLYKEQDAKLLKSKLQKLYPDKELLCEGTQFK